MGLGADSIAWNQGFRVRSAKSNGWLSDSDYASMSLKRCILHRRAGTQMVYEDFVAHGSDVNPTMILINYFLWPSIDQ